MYYWYWSLCKYFVKYKENVVHERCRNLLLVLCTASSYFYHFKIYMTASKDCRFILFYLWKLVFFPDKFFFRVISFSFRRKFSLKKYEEFLFIGVNLIFSGKYRDFFFFFYIKNFQNCTHLVQIHLLSMSQKCDLFW